MAQPYLRGNRWYLKYKDAAGRWQDKVCDAKSKGRAAELQREIQVAEDRARHGLDQRPPKDGGGTVDEMVEWWVNQFLAKRASYAQCIGTIRKHIIGSKLGGDGWSTSSRDTSRRSSRRRAATSRPRL